jgi:hypothetical protein
MSAITFATKRQAKVFDSGDARLVQRVVAVAPAVWTIGPRKDYFSRQMMRALSRS